MTILSERTVKKTRVAFRCDICRRMFEPGATKHVKVIKDGELYEWTTCVTCEWMESLYVDTSEDSPFDEYTADQVIDNLGELIGYWGHAWDLLDMICSEVTTDSTTIKTGVVKE